MMWKCSKCGEMDNEFAVDDICIHCADALQFDLNIRLIRLTRQLNEVRREKKMVEIKFEDIKEGQKIELQTRNTLYKLKRNPQYNEHYYIIQGGRYFPEPTEVRINGCTWGGSMIWVDGLRVGMYMEIECNDGKRIITSGISEIRISKEDLNI